MAPCDPENKVEMSDAPATGAASPAQTAHSTHSSPAVVDDRQVPRQATEVAKPADATQAPMTDAEESQAADDITVGHHLLHHRPQNNDDGADLEQATTVAGSSSHDGASPMNVPDSIAFRLYTSHFLSTWNSRLFEFGAALFLTSIFPGTLLPVSVYSLVRNAGYIIFSQPLGVWINKGNRLNVIRTSIVAQRLPVAASCALLLVLELKGATLGYRKDDGVFAVIVLLAVVEKLASTMNTISVERDWVSSNKMTSCFATAAYVVHRLLLSPREMRSPGEVSDLAPLCQLSHSCKTRMQWDNLLTCPLEMNARMRRIDLFCKLMGPLTISLVAIASTEIAIYTTLAMNVASVIIEYVFIEQVNIDCAKV